jgi:hypothetical protein
MGACLSYELQYGELLFNQSFLHLHYVCIRYNEALKTLSAAQVENFLNLDPVTSTVTTFILKRKDYNYANCWRLINTGGHFLNSTRLLNRKLH